MNIERIKHVRVLQFLKYGIFAVFVLATFYLLFQRQPFYDEAHAWMIAKSFGFFELFKIEKYEGHLFLWHTILMPFAKNNFFYPYPMFILNWLFCLFSTIILWKSSPFSFFEKTLITFSYPFFCYFAIVARCYSVGILFLFLILAFWKERLKRPLLISILLVLCANTSLMALIGAFVIGLIFIYDLIKSKTNIKFPFLILLFGVVLVAIQLFGAHHPDIDAASGQYIYVLKFMAYFFLFDFSRLNDINYVTDKLSAILIMLTYASSLFVFVKNKKTSFFFFATLFLMNYIFIFKYAGAFWHYLFFYIYLIMTLWLYRLETPENSDISYKIFNRIFKLLLILFCFMTLNFDGRYLYEVYNSKSGDISKEIKAKELFHKNDKIYALDFISQTSTGILPYFSNLEIYDIRGNKKYTEEEYKSFDKNFSKFKLIDNFAQSLDEKRINKGITDRKMFPFYEGENYVIALKPLYENKELNFRIYEIRKYGKKYGKKD